MPSQTSFFFFFLHFVAFAFTCGYELNCCKFITIIIIQSGASARTVASSFIARMHRPQRCQQYFKCHLACTHISHNRHTHPICPYISTTLSRDVRCGCGSVITILHRLGERNYDMLVVTKIKYLELRIVLIIIMYKTITMIYSPSAGSLALNWIMEKFIHSHLFYFIWIESSRILRPPHYGGTCVFFVHKFSANARSQYRSYIGAKW